MNTIARYLTCGGELVVVVTSNVEQATAWFCEGCRSGRRKTWADTGVPGYSMAKREMCAANWCRSHADEHASKCRAVAILPEGGA